MNIRDPHVPATAILTHTGRIVDLARPSVDVVSLVDIAHALARINRFTGHGERGFSVAQHSILVSYLAPPECRAWSLLHDSPEAYTGDISAPLKALLAGHTSVLQNLQHDWEVTIGAHFGVAPCNVKCWDNEALLAEVLANGPHGLSRLFWETRAGVRADGIRLACAAASMRLHTWMAERLFLERAAELGIREVTS